MVINMAAGSSEAELQHVIERVIECGFQPHVTRGAERASTWPSRSRSGDM